MQFLYKGPVRLIGIYYSGPSWIVLLAVILLALALIGIIIVTGPASIVRIIRGK